MSLPPPPPPAIKPTTDVVFTHAASSSTGSAQTVVVATRGSTSTTTALNKPMMEESTRDPIPDGGIRAWLVVLGGFLDFAIAFGLVNSFGTFQAVYESQWKASTSTVTWIGSVQLFILFLGGTVCGSAFDKWGSRKLMLSGTVICLISFIATSFATKYYQYLLAQGILFGIGNAMLFYPATGAISEWFDQKRGLALGLALSGASVGGIIWPLIVGKLFTVVSTAWVHRIIAAISIPILLVSCFFVKERKASEHTPASNTAATATDITATNNETTPTTPAKQTIKDVISEWRFLALCAALFFIYGGMLIPFYYIPLFAMEQGVNPTMANNLLAIGYAGSVVGRVSSGWIADRVGRFNVLLVVAIGTGIVTVCWVKMTSFGAMVASTILFCLFSGGLIPLGSACVAQTTTDMQNIGLRIGVMMTICSFAALRGGPISGYIKDNGGSWFGVYAFSAGGTLLGAVMLLAVRLCSQKKWNAVV
ncbi:MFS-type transporter pynF [Cladobotryum mycophilum]|uniref:MFS-type transporter pynF n=1 Tax=Cladobotryum mycophilum TaxID=491253 RepID=A0ABR0S5U1_9HYPO